MDTVESRPYKVVFPFPELPTYEESYMTEDMKVSMPESTIQRALIFRKFHQDLGDHFKLLNLENPDRLRCKTWNRGMLCGVNDKADYDLLLSSTNMICHPHDSNEFDKMPYKVIYESQFTESDELRENTDSELNFSLFSHFMSLRLSAMPLQRTLNERIVVAVDNESDYNTLLSSTKWVCKPYTS